LEVPLSSVPIEHCNESEMQPHLLRFETIKLLKELIARYPVNFDEARALLLEKTAEFEGWQLNDEMSTGIIKNLKE
jgi:hypothetical protein